jgi:hypothetical protein
VSGLDQARRPAVAATESWNPGSETAPGSASSMPSTASPRYAAACPARPDSLATMATPPISAARTTLADAPAATVYRAIAARMARERGLRGTRRSSAANTDPTSAMFQPLMATTWLIPDRAKASATSRGTRSRSPIRIPDARPACGDGRVRASTSAPARLTCSSRPARPVGGARSRPSARPVATTPLRAR